MSNNFLRCRDPWKASTHIYIYIYTGDSRESDYTSRSRAAPRTHTRAYESASIIRRPGCTGRDFAGHCWLSGSFITGTEVLVVFSTCDSLPAPRSWVPFSSFGSRTICHVISQNNLALRWNLGNLVIFYFSRLQT